MGTRPLRQRYDDDAPALVVDALLDDLADVWSRHRRRLDDALGALDDDQWAAPTRCDAWSVAEVVNHLHTTDGFWAASLSAGRAGTPSRFIEGFDPSATPDDLVQAMGDEPPAAVLARFRRGLAPLADVVASLDGDDWDRPAESPIGHAPIRLVLGHALWDSWLHERDILEPLGLAGAPDPGDVRGATLYALVVLGVQGGLLGDPDPVGPGLTEPVDVTLAFSDLPDAPVRVQIDTGVRLSPGDPAAAIPAGAALDLVEIATGRRAGDLDLPDVLADQLARARQVL